MLATESTDNAYSLKSLTRYRFDKITQRSKLKQSPSRLVNILFPELESVLFTFHSNSIYVMLQNIRVQKMSPNFNFILWLIERGIKFAS